MSSREPWLDPEFRCRSGECMKCGAVLDAGSHPDGLKPNDGDSTICVYCGPILVFEDGAPRMANERELGYLSDVDEIKDALRAVKSAERNPAWGRWPNGKGPKPALGKSGVAA